VKPSIDALSSGSYPLLGTLDHPMLAEFVIEYFLRRPSWLTRTHHAMSIATIGAIVWVAIEQGRPLLRCAGDFLLALLALFVVILPVHELVHALAYRIAGARDIRWEYSARMAAVWVVAHRFVVGRRAFVFVALAPFVVINAAVIAGAILFAAQSVFLLFVLLWHLHGCAGDWALLNFVWLHRRRGFWTYDDAVAGKSYFHGDAHPESRV
jgi:hypothetical protein